MNPVQQKISCAFEIGVTDESSNKRGNQTYKVSALRAITEQAERDDISAARSTEKLDGTCCLIQEFQGRPWLWARHDRKPSKTGERRFALFKKSHLKSNQNGENISQGFSWNPAKDFKAILFEPPPNWVPASRLEIKDGFVLPDNIGHTPGWVPVQQNCRQQCWHLSAVDFKQSLALIVREAQGDAGSLVLESQPLSQLCGQTCELIGTNINGNPYNLGTKQCPVHVLVPHGSLSLQCPQPSNYDTMIEWFASEAPDAQVEGIVWHCSNGALYKIHRHHLNLKWPVAEPWLCQKKIKVSVASADVETTEGIHLFSQLAHLNGKIFNSLKELHLGFDIVSNS
ncbi:unnamed protein product [Lymnaea stagnalis]|uniref:RNA ligase 1 n=1 Tax=Lymnaea stagnalis TaxID=6523 RepID=A0AAV2H6N9_LYMST